MSKKILTALCLTGLLLHAEETRPKNIILFIGDGMGIAQVTAGKIAKGTLEMERCPVAGLASTWSADHLTTDSAAAATALATGTKTDNGMLSLNPEGQRLKTVLEIAEDQKKSTGLVCNCAVTHATPAGFATHVPSRQQYVEIARQLADSDVDVLFGGGLAYFSPSNAPSCLPQLQNKMPLATTAEEFYALGTPEKAAALLYPEHPPHVAERTVSLKELTQKAIEILVQDEDGFFLMVEGSQIDWAGHKNDAANIISEVIDFDDAVGVGLDFAEKNGRTLVIITADHETGGFAVIDGTLAEKTVSQTGFIHKKHTASMVPVFAEGPASSRFSGIMDNTDIGKTMIELIQTSE
ncbi:alkaline phosphatase [Tichowtungia aerotolerans]|uniref:Alkaline phosphatase n=1 Tax=Tichowtungia aerotolerans TaxID=2697043 RepID=A0A6P1MDL5_9BACT|nr:alkaline phosphatase [Tichowtungia aerotolerans]QHI70168.1 alkaline phosphatase [Tichowtungia aerotolerans]